MQLSQLRRISNSMGRSAYIIKKKRKRTLIALLSIAAALMIAIAVHLAVNVNPIIETVVCEEARSSTTIIVNESIKSVTGNSIKYDDLVTIEKDSESNVQSLSVNTMLASSIAMDVTIVTQSKLKSQGEIVARVPVGTLSGIFFLSGKGGIVNVRCMPVGSVSISFKSTFRSAGINNTLHSITMVVSTGVSVIVPGFSENFNVQTEVPIVDTMIVGKVPDTYLQSNLLDEMLNLIP